MIFHTGDVLRNCIKIQYYTSAFCYFFMYYNHQQDTQDANKPCKIESINLRLIT